MGPHVAVAVLPLASTAMTVNLIYVDVLAFLTSTLLLSGESMTPSLEQSLDPVLPLQLTPAQGNNAEGARL
jgi:hypothetical protein